MDEQPRWWRFGGSLEPDWIETVAAAALVGIDPVTLLRADPLLRNVLLDVAQSGVKLAAIRDESLARRIINTLAESLKRR